MPDAPSAFEASRGTGEASQVASKVGLFGGNSLITLGALVILFAFLLPWASCGNMELSGLDIVTQSARYSQYGYSEGPSLGPAIALVPLGAIALLVLGAGGLVVGVFEKSLPERIGRLAGFLPLIAALPGLCSCCLSSAFFLNVQNARSDPESLGLGMMIQIEYGFWLTVFGLGVSFIGVVAALVGGFVARRRTSNTNPT